MQDAYRIEAAPERVDAWADFRLPFEPRDVKKRFRDELRAAIEAMRLPDRALLAGTYSSVDTSMCDVENVLLYNVGISAFRPHTRAGLQLERAFIQRAGSEPAASRAHYHEYLGLSRASHFLHWKPTATLAEAHDVRVCPPLDRPAAWWAAVKKAERRAVMGATDGDFGLDIVLHQNQVGRPWVHTALKPMLDGVIAAFHAHDGSAMGDLDARIAAATTLPPDEVRRLLSDDAGNALGRRRVVWPYGAGVQWNPADDRCVAVRVVVGPTREQPAITVKLLDVQPDGSLQWQPRSTLLRYG